MPRKKKEAERIEYPWSKYIYISLFSNIYNKNNYEME